MKRVWLMALSSSAPRDHTAAGEHDESRTWTAEISGCAGVAPALIGASEIATSPRRQRLFLHDHDQRLVLGGPAVDDQRLAVRAPALVAGEMDEFGGHASPSSPPVTAAPHCVR